MYTYLIHNVTNAVRARECHTSALLQPREVSERWLDRLVCMDATGHSKRAWLVRQSHCVIHVCVASVTPAGLIRQVPEGVCWGLMLVVLALGGHLHKDVAKNCINLKYCKF